MCSCEQPRAPKCRAERWATAPAPAWEGSFPKPTLAVAETVLAASILAATKVDKEARGARPPLVAATGPPGRLRVAQLQVRAQEALPGERLPHA